MSQSGNSLLALTCLALLGACAAHDELDQYSANDERDVAPTCGRDEVAVCVDVDCQPAEFVCTRKDEIRDMFESRIDR